MKFCCLCFCLVLHYSFKEIHWYIFLSTAIAPFLYHFMYVAVYPKADINIFIRKDGWDCGYKCAFRFFFPFLVQMTSVLKPCIELCFALISLWSKNKAWAESSSPGLGKRCGGGGGKESFFTEVALNKVGGLSPRNWQPMAQRLNSTLCLVCK